jgi:signal transduction histidine kinase
LSILPSKEQVEALHNLANNIAVAMENAHLYGKERERAAALQSLEQLKTNFMLDISHELKTPLTSLIVSAGLLKEEVHSEDGTPVNRLLTGMIRSIDRLNRLVNDLLEAARLEHATVELDWKYTDVVSIVKLVTTTFAPMMEAKGQQFIMKVPPDGLYAWMDMQRMEQLASNLVSNAYKFTPAGGSIQLVLTDEGNDFILEVSDTGPGIAEDEQKLIFEPFYRARGMPRHTGSGLGLTIARRLAELLGGSISVRSNVGHGAIFTIVLPKGIGKKNNVVVQ